MATKKQKPVTKTVKVAKGPKNLVRKTSVSFRKKIANAFKK